MYACGYCKLNNIVDDLKNLKNLELYNHYIISFLLKKIDGDVM